MKNNIINMWAALAKEDYERSKPLNEAYARIEDVIQQALGVLLSYVADDKSNSELRVEAIRILSELRVRDYMKVHPQDEKLWDKLKQDDGEEF